MVRYQNTCRLCCNATCASPESVFKATKDIFTRAEGRRVGGFIGREVYKEVYKVYKEVYKEVIMI